MKKLIGCAIKSVFALALAVYAGTAEAAWKYRYAQCKVVVDPSGKGLACTYQDKTDEDDRTYSDTEDETGAKTLLYPTSSGYDIEFYCYAKGKDSISDFLSWKNSSGTVLSTSASYTHKIYATGYSDNPTKETIYAYYHVHTMEYVANELTITYQCSNEDGNCVSKPSKSATLSAEDKVYDGTAYAATVTGDTTATLKYYSGEGEIDAPVNAGSYTVKMTYGDKTVSKGFSITAAPIDAITLKKTEFFYTGNEQTVELNPVTASEGTFTLTEGTDYTVTGNKATGNPTQDTQCTVTVTGKGNYQGTQTANWVIKGHTHNFTCTPSEGKLTIVCNGTTTCTIPGGTSLEIVCENAGMTYDGSTTLTAYVKDNTPEQSSSAYTFETYTGGSYTEISWDDASANAGSHTASFKATVNGVEYTISKTFTIAQRDIADAVMTLSADWLYYTAADQSVTITSVKAGGLDVSYTEDEDSVRTEKAIGTYTVKITANGNFTGALSKTWEIKNTPTTSGGGVTGAAVSGGVTAESETSFTVLSENSKSLEYAYDANSGTHTWWATIKLTYAKQIDDCTSIFDDYGSAKYTHPTAAKFTVDGTTYTVDAAKNAGGSVSFAHSIAMVTTDSGTYDYSTVASYDYYATETISYRVGFSLGEAQQAIKDNVPLTFTINAGAIVDTTTAKPHNSTTFYSVAFRDYTVTIPVNEAGYTLYDQYGNQVYPDAGYVAQVGNYKYTTLAEAMTHATSELPVTLIGDAEAGTFEIGQNITVNLGGFGNAEASYKFVNVTDEAMAAKVVSTKAENVTTEVTGFAVNNDNYTYTLYRAHMHLWEAATSGATLTASCTNMLTNCDIDGRQTAITLTVTGGSDGVAPTFAIDNKDDFLSKVNKFSEVAVIGEITVVRTTDDGAAYDKWYVGNYKASCIVTVNGEEKTITQDFAIGGALQDGGYSTSVGGLTIRYGTFDEALVAAEAGSTIYYRGGDVSDESTQALTFANVNKDITLDFGGKTFWYRGDADAYVIMSGTGTLTLQNIVLQQPRDKPSVGSYSYNDIVLAGGSFILGNNVTGASTDSKHLALKAVNASVEVQTGLYKCSFWAGENGSVSLKGGEYWSNFNPADTTYVASGYVTVDATTEGYTYKVVPHSHDFYYETNGNVIAIKCQGAGYEGCAWTLNENKLTLTAADAFEGTTYTGASYTYDDSFLFDGEADPEIEYYKDDVKVSTPSEYGNYEARVTVTINGHTATAVKAFAIKHVHQFKYDIAPSAVLTATCTNKVSDCDIEGRSTTITLTVTGGSDGVAPTFAIANKDAFLGFVNRDATVASIGEITTVRTTEDGAAVSRWYVGNYTASCIVTISGVEYTLTQDFSIAKPEGGYTSGWEVGSSGIRYIEDDLSIVYETAKDGDTIYYRDGDRKNEEHAYSDYGKSLTFDFGGYTLTKNANTVMTIKNTGSGVLTFQNVVIKQPKGSLYANNVETEGDIRFGVGVQVVNQDDEFTITANSGTLQVTNGLYNCSFDTAGGTNEISGGKFWSSYDPSQYVNVNDHLVREIEGDYKYEVVAHTHVRTYSADGTVITCHCVGDDAAYCGYNTDKGRQTATLVANDAAESSEPYAGASVTYSQYFPDQSLVITYWNGDEQLAGAPTRFGTYTAKITIGDATAAKDFTITPMAVTITVENAEHATVKVYEGDTELSSQTTEYSVTHGNKVTAIYTADEGYVPTAVTNVLESAEPGDTITAPIFTEAAVTFTLAAPANASVTKAVTNGVEMVAPYKVLPGTVVTVTYKANTGYLFANGTDTMDAEITVNEAGEQPAPEGTETTEGAAKIGTQYYLTLQAAVDAAAGATVELVKGITLEARVDVTNDVTVDLAGYTITPTATCGNGSAFNVVAGTVTINNGAIDGSAITSIECDPITVRSGAEVTLEELAITINSKNGACAYAFDGGKVTITSGAYTNLTDETYQYNPNFKGMLVNQENVAKQLVFITGGTFKGQNPAEGDDSGSVKTFLAEGYYSWKQADGSWLVNDVEPAAKIGTQYYLTLADALTNAADQATVTVLKDCSVDARINLAADKSVTLDANGKTITTAAGIYAFVIGGTETQNDSGVLTVTGDGTFYAPTADGTCFLWARHGNIVVESGSFSMDGSAQCVYADNGCTVTINGGTFVNRTGVDVLNVHNSRSVITDIQCYAGSYSKDPATGDDALGGSFVANGYRSVKNEVTGLWDVEKGPAIVEPIGGDPKETPEIKPVEGTNGVYVVEVKTNTTTAVEITGLGGDDTVIVPPQINAVNGTETSPIAPEQVKVVADATNTTGKVQVEITPAFTITESDNGVLIELNSNAVVTVEIAGKDPETIPVKPVLTEADDPVKPLVMADENVAVGVKTIPGLTYNLLAGDELGKIDTIVKTIVAEDTRIVLEAAKDIEDTAKFYKIEVTK